MSQVIQCYDNIQYFVMSTKGGWVTAGVCLLVFLSLIKISQKAMSGF